jgi:predicted transcriptional regulator
MEHDYEETPRRPDSASLILRLRILPRPGVLRYMSHVMKQKIGTIVDGKLLKSVKQRAALEGKALSGLIEDALAGYLDRSPGGDDALRALEKFASHGGLLPREDIEEILREDVLAP